MPDFLLLAKLIILAMLFGLLAPKVSHADGGQDFQSWFLVTTTTPLDQNKTLNLYLEAQPRFGDNSSQLERLLLRPGLSFSLTPKIALTAGYAWTPTYIDQQYNRDFRNEQRIWEQLSISHGDEYVFSHRIRQEQRYIQDAAKVAHRTRYLLRLSHALYAPAQECDSSIKTVGATAYNEYFLNWNTVERGPRRGWDRDRFFVGPYFLIVEARVEVGYFSEYGNNFNGGNRMINGVLTAVNFSF